MIFCQHESIIIFIILGNAVCTKNRLDRKVLLDVSFNRFTRENDGSLGLWSYYGIAKESNATEREFLYNGDIVDPETFFSSRKIIHPFLSTETHPKLDMNSDLDEHYLRYLILQAIVVNADGFIVEWGFKDHQSDLVLQKLLGILKTMPLKKFLIGINWCDHWLTQHYANRTSKEIAEIFRNNTEYLISTVYYTNNNPLVWKDQPIILLFGGGLTPQQFIESIEGSTDKRPIWIGNYLNIGSNTRQKREWAHLMNGTFAWASHSRSTKGQPHLDRWDTYTTPEDAVLYQKNVSDWAQEMIQNDQWILWGSSANPGEDNRPCAGWGQTLKFVPRVWHTKNMFKEQWKFISNYSNSNFVIIPTLNDFSESTVILPTVEYGFQALRTMATYSKLYKGQIDSYSKNLIVYPAKWFRLIKRIRILQHITEVGKIQELLERAFTSISLNKTLEAEELITQAKIEITQLETCVKWKYLKIWLPDESNTSFYIDSENPLRLKVSENHAKILQATTYYKGLLSFEYVPFYDGHSQIRVLGSSSRKASPFLFYHKNGQVESSNFGVVCDIHAIKYQKGDSIATSVELIHSNLDWKHRLKEGTDLAFTVLQKKASFFVGKICLHFYIPEIKLTEIHQ